MAWEVPRWKAPPKPKPEVPSEDPAVVSAEGSSKENKENGVTKSDNSNNDTGNGNSMDVEMQSAVPSPAAANSPAPAPFAIAAATA